MVEDQYNTQVIKLTRTLGPLESKVMQIIWRNRKSTVRQVVEKLKTDRQLAYTTVMTVMDNLYKKRILKRTKSQKTYLYYPAENKETFERNKVAEIFNQLFNQLGKGRVLFLLLITLMPLLPKFGFILRISKITLLKTPLIYAISLIALAFASVFSLVNFFQKFILAEIHEYLKLIIQDPDFFLRNRQLISQAFLENFPILNFLIVILFSIILIFMLKKFVKNSAQRSMNYA